MWWLAACVASPPVDPTGPSSSTDEVAVADVALASGYQGADFFGHLFRGRCALVGDLDLDGDPDEFSGNPGETSFVVLNTTVPGGPLRFALGPVVAEGHLSWGGALADLDNDGDPDLFVSGGGNEAPDHSFMFRNEVVPTGTLSFVDLTEGMGVGGPHLPGADRPAKVPSANAHAVDFDNDARIDLFVNVGIEPATRIPELTNDPSRGQNILWHQTEAGFEDLAVAAGITSTDASQHSVFLDWDQDGDQDLYENANRSPQHLWRNLLVETGEARFEDATAELSLGDGDLRFPFDSFTAAAADFNLDGWEDVIVFVRAFEEIPESPYHDGHVLLLNAHGEGFVDVAPLTGVNDPYINWEQDTFRDHSGGGVMGANVGDVNADGIPDVYVGQGGQNAGTADIFFLSTGLREVTVDGLGTVNIPQYVDSTALIDFPAPEDPDAGVVYPPYPYRTHAVNFVDFDGDGTVEISVHNGGPAALPDLVREPPRLFQFALPAAPRWFGVTLDGDGVTVARSPIGAKVTATVLRVADGASWTLTRWVKGGNGFSATNGQELYFGLADADVVTSATVTWPDGETTAIEPPPQIGERRVIDR
ncbi:MAG: CRTAC1 family protein [Myxococcota bacterium]